VAAGRLRWRWVWATLGVFVVLTPLGLIAPGSAFGEDAPADLDLRKYHLDAVPSGLRHYASFWHNTLFDGYGFANDAHPALGYLVSALAGIAAIAVVVLAAFGVARGVRRSRPDDAPIDLRDREPVAS
jgi:cobalt/nickel transport system permease protein